MELANHLKKLKSFIAMELMEEALLLKNQGHDVISLALGEPDFAPPRKALSALQRALSLKQTYYTHSQGILELRQGICDHYRRRYGVSLLPEQIFLSSGSSPAILMALGTLLQSRDEVLIPELHYPCYPNFIHFFNAKTKLIPCSPKDHFEFTFHHVQNSISSKTKAILLSNPSNPLGKTLKSNLLKKIASLDIPVIMDEIYQGLCYEGEERSILEFTDHAFVLNGFSKSFCMTGFRLGYLIAPLDFVPSLQKMFQNFFISTNTFVQYAGLSVIKDSERIQKRYREQFRKRRELICEEILKSGFTLYEKPNAAFYVFVNIEKVHSNSYEFCQNLLKEQFVALTPGIDFGQIGEGHVRFSYANNLDNIKKSFQRIRNFLGR